MTVNSNHQPLTSYFKNYMNDRDKSLREFSRLLDIIDELRLKCPWDMKQTYESLRKLTIEETYELADSIFSGNEDGIKKRRYSRILSSWQALRVGISL